MRNVEQLISGWTEEMYARLNQAQKQIEEATRADYHKGYAEGISAGISYAMAIMHRTERQLKASKIESAEKIKQHRLAPYAGIPAIPVVKRVVAWKCSTCTDTAVTFQDPDQPVFCVKCNNTHKFRKLYKASYYCDCGKICKFMMEDSVKEVKCHGCKKVHRMRFSDINGDYYSLDNRKRQEHTQRVAPTQNSGVQTEAPKKATEAPKKPVQHKYSNAKKLYSTQMYKNRCLVCGNNFISDLDGEAVCPLCLSDNR